MDALKVKGLKLFVATAIFGLLLAQLGSYLIEQNLPLYESVSLTGFLKFTHVRNMGGIFGVFQGKGWIFTTCSIAFLGGLSYWVWTDRQLRLFQYVCCGLIFAGGASNVLDRLIYGSVIDFIDVRGIPGWNYIFNTADTLIHLGIWPWLLFSYIASRKPQRPTEASLAPEP